MSQVNTSQAQPWQSVQPKRTGKKASVEAENAELKRRNSYLESKLAKMEAFLRSIGFENGKPKPAPTTQGCLAKPAPQHKEASQSGPDAKVNDQASSNRCAVLQSQIAPRQPQANTKRKISNSSDETEPPKKVAPATQTSSFETSAHPPLPATPRRRQPPIQLFSDNKNFRAIPEKIKAQVKNLDFAPEFRASEQKLTVLTFSAKDHEAVIRLLKVSEDCPFFTHPRKEEKRVRATLRGLPNGFTVEEVKEDLVNQGLKVESVNQFTDRQTKSPIAVYGVLMAPGILLADVNKIRQVHGFSIRWSRSTKRPGQARCLNCQGHNHTKAFCYRKVSCGKCAGNHATPDCIAEEVKCTNCGGEHYAEDVTCPISVKLAKHAEKRSRKPARRVTNGVSFASVAATPPSAVATDNNANQLQAATQLVALLNDAQDDQAKMAGFLNFMLTYFQKCTARK